MSALLPIDCLGRGRGNASGATCPDAEANEAVAGMNLEDATRKLSLVDREGRRAAFR